MKKFLTVLLSAALFAACGGEDPIKPEPPKPEPPKTEDKITLVGNGNVSFGSDGGNATVSFSSSADWSVSSSEAWCKVSPDKGTAGSAKVTVSVAGNEGADDRTASVKIKAGKAEQTVTVTQKQKNALTVTQARFDVKAEGGEIEIEVKANVDFEYEVGASWISYVSTKALKTSTLVFAISENEDTAPREGSITIKNGDLSETITVCQEGTEPAIVLSRKEYEVSSQGETLKIEVSSNVEVEVSIPSADWIREDVTRSMSSHTYIFNIAANESVEQRVGEIHFTNAENGLSEVVTVTQMQKDALVISQDEYKVSEDGGEIMVEVGHNVDFDVEIGVDWIQKIDTRAYQTDWILFNVSGNEGESDREGIITFTSEDKKIVQTVRVVQSGSRKPDGNIDDMPVQPW